MPFRYLQRAQKHPLVGFLLKAGISLGILWVLAQNLRQDTLARAMTQLPLPALLAAVAFYLFGQGVSALRWQWLLHAMQVKAQWLQCFRLYLQGMFTGLFLPSSVGGDVSRALMLARENRQSYVRSFLSIIAERLTGLLGLLLVMWVCFVLVHPVLLAKTVLLAMTGLTVLTLSLTFGLRRLVKHRWGKVLIERALLKNATQGEEGEAIDATRYWPHTGSLIRVLIVGMVFHLLSAGLQVWLIGQLHGHIAFATMALIYGLAAVASLFPSLNGIGVREGTLVFLLTHWAGLPADVATVFSLVWLAILVLAALPGGLLLLKRTLLGRGQPQSA